MTSNNGQDVRLEVEAALRTHHVKQLQDSGLDDETIKGAMLQPCDHIETTITELLQKYGQEARICALPEGPQTIPYVK